MVMNWKRGLGEVALIFAAIAASVCFWAVWLSGVKALMDRPADSVGPVVLTLAVIVALTPGPLSNAAGMAGFGLLIGALGMDVNSGMVRDLWGFTISVGGDIQDPDLFVLDWALVLPLVLVFGFLLPLAAAYASEPAAVQRRGWYRFVYDMLFLGPCYPALLLMRQPWVKPPWVLPCVVFWGALLCVWLKLPVTQIPLTCLGVFALGLLCLRLDLNWAPFCSGFVLSPVLEDNLRRTLLLSKGNLWTLLCHPITATTLGGALLALLCGMGARTWARRRAAKHAAAFEQPAPAEPAQPDFSPSRERTSP